MKTYYRVASALAAIAVAIPIQAAAPRAPTGKWVVDFADHQCVASRNYGPPSEPLYLVLKPSPMGEVMQISVVRKGTFGEPIQVPAAFQFDKLEPIPSSLLAYTSKSKGVRINTINLPLEIFAPMRQAKNFSIRASGEVNQTFALGQMTPLMAAMDRCLVDLQQFWNIGEANSAKLKERAKSKASLASYFSNNDYPDVAIRNDEGGTVQFALLIDETGKIADCMVIATSNVASLDAQTCAIMTTRAKFIPAIGADGKPAKDAHTSRIRWEIPGD